MILLLEQVSGSTLFPHVQTKIIGQNVLSRQRTTLIVIQAAVTEVGKFVFSLVLSDISHCISSYMHFAINVDSRYFTCKRKPKLILNTETFVPKCCDWCHNQHCVSCTRFTTAQNSTPLASYS